jgi:O-antigen/teichoic acid export membrane protein
MNRLVYYAVLYTGTAGFLKLAGFFLFMWLAQTQSVESYANFGLLYALQTGLTTFSLVGILEAVAGLLKENRSDDKKKQLFTAANRTFVITLISSIVFGIILYVSLFGSSEISFFALFSVLSSGSLIAYSMLQAQILRLEEKHLSSICFSFIFPLVGLIGSLVAYFLVRTVQSFFWGSSIGMLIALSGLWISHVGFYNMTGQMIDTRQILLRITPFIAIAFFGWLSGYGNNYIVKLFFAPKELAKFTFALTISSIMQLIATALNQVWAPRFYRITHEFPFEQVEKKNLRFYRIQSLVLGFFGGVSIVLFPIIMSIFKGNLSYYKSMTLEIGLLFSSYVILSPWWHCSNYFLAYDKGPILMKITLITSALGIFTWIILMWQLGSIGIYIGFLTQMLIRSIGISIIAKKQWPVKLSWDSAILGIILTFLGFAFSKI